MDEDALVRQLEELERTVAKGGAVGAEACRAELTAWRRLEADGQFRFSLPTPTSQVVFLTLCHAYGLQPYRVPKQRKTTISVRAPNGFITVVFAPRVEAMLRAVEEAALNAVRRVMQKWSTKTGVTHESVCPECGQAESAIGGALEAGEESAPLTSDADSHGRVMIES